MSPIETELADQPEVRAQILRTLGAACFSQGRYDAAGKNLPAALAAQERLYGRENADTIATMMELGGVAAHKLNCDEAATLFEKCVAFTLGSENVYLAYDLYEQALTFSQMKKCEQAEAKAREALAIHQKVSHRTAP